MLYNGASHSRCDPIYRVFLYLEFGVYVAKSITNGVPKHIAIIMDGNGRWAKKRFLPRFIGHQRGLSALRKLIPSVINEGIESITLFAFSTENWKRPQEEVNQLMKLFLGALKKEVAKIHENNIRLKIIGDISAFPEEIQLSIAESEAMTSQNSGLQLNIAANYGGRWDVVTAVQKWQAANPDKNVAEMTEEDISNHVCLAELPEPDLLIRTGGESRISNFLIWQMAYTEFYFTDTLWPDFDDKALKLAIDSFQNRERRFGKTSEQVQAK